MDRDTVQEFRRSLRTLEQQVERALIEQTECCGVSLAQCHLILEVEEVGEASIGELAVLLELDASTLSRTVDSLVKAGLLSRTEDPGNRRRQIVRLSDSGYKRAAQINDLCDSWYGALLSSLPESETRILLDSLPILVRALSGWRKSSASSQCCLPRREIEAGRAGENLVSIK